MDRSYFAAMYLRPLLPAFVPGDSLMWIDADCWVQDPTVIDDFRQAAVRARNGIAICSMIDPDYDGCMNGLVKDQEWYRDLHERIFGETVAGFLFGRAVFSTGVFCMRRDSPVWAAWEAEVRRIYDEVRPPGDLGHMAEQCAMNKVLHEMQGYAVLPSMNNWHCHGATMERRDGQVVVASSLRAPRIVHLSAFRNAEATYRAARLLQEPCDLAPPTADPPAQATRLRHELATARHEIAALRQRVSVLEAERDARPRGMWSRVLHAWR